MAEEMCVRGYHFSASEVKIKIHNFTNKYREEKKKVGPSGGSPSRWRYYQRIHQLLGGYKAFNIESVIEESKVIDYLEKSVDIRSSTPISDESVEPAKKRKMINFQEEILSEFKKSNKKVLDFVKCDYEETKNFQTQMITIEERKNHLLEVFRIDAK
ncbi:PREDICTED: uncharacterized protein LOC108360591 [Rhagoletis zephyria]|uniref:uncharacterized protein LOC108360591 n=1 Tax=Rhagoletis zephyria TaxID=28612 RepID=UPI0008113FE2|nr:PREDICTED: uncharacterized protein LOC108360591 [Rhagoletis zephyria]